LFFSTQYKIHKNNLQLTDNFSIKLIFHQLETFPRLTRENFETFKDGLGRKKSEIVEL
jgi:hypothetical protein